MATNETPRTAKAPLANGFQIANGPVVRGVQAEDAGLDFGGLPRVYGPPLLFAIARDPRTLFVYWNVDWSDVFEAGEPIDRQVYVRIKKSDGSEESQARVEPMLGSYYASVAEAGATYRVELGYYGPEGAWKPVAKSDSVTTPAAGASQNVELDLATIPFHLSFQRLVDLFRSSNRDALTTILARLQSRAVTAEERALLTDEEWELLRAMDISIDELEAGRKGFTDRSDQDLLRKRTEAILGFGATSPAQGFGQSSWS